MGDSRTEDMQLRQVEDWLLALLRFAVTRNEADRATVMAKAEQMDRAGPRFEQPTFTFFARTSTELCAAIAAPADLASRTTLQRQLKKVGDGALRRALEAAVALEPARPTGKVRSSNRSHLWRGLPSTRRKSK